MIADELRNIRTKESITKADKKGLVRKVFAATAVGVSLIGFQASPAAAAPYFACQSTGAHVGLTSWGAVGYNGWGAGCVSSRKSRICVQLFNGDTGAKINNPVCGKYSTNSFRGTNTAYLPCTPGRTYWAQAYEQRYSDGVTGNTASSGVVVCQAPC